MYRSVVNNKYYSNGILIEIGTDIIYNLDGYFYIGEVIDIFNNGNTILVNNSNNNNLSEEIEEHNIIYRLDWIFDDLGIDYTKENVKKYLFKIRNMIHNIHSRSIYCYNLSNNNNCYHAEDDYIGNEN
jgi:hypothetical protein